MKSNILTPGKAHLIMMMGQSNMVGRAQIRFLEETATPEELAEYRAGYEDILIYYHTDHANGDSTNIAPGFVPVTLGQGSTNVQFGPEVSLAAYLTRAFPGEKFYLIKCAWSGSGIANNYKPGDVVFEEILKRTQIGLNYMIEAGLEPELFAFCWMQGETDAIVQEQAEDYLRAQGDLMARWLPLYDAIACPNGVAFIDAGISEHWPFYQTVNDAKAQYQTQGANRYYFDTIQAGLTTHLENNDVSHYDSQAKIKLGRLFGQCIEAFLKGENQ